MRFRTKCIRTLDDAGLIRVYAGLWRTASTLQTQTIHASKHMTASVAVDDVCSSQLGDRIVRLRPMRLEVCAAGR